MYVINKFCFVVGVSECIIMGIPMNIGTGMFKLLHKYPFRLYTVTKVFLFDFESSGL